MRSLLFLTVSAAVLSAASPGRAGDISLDPGDWIVNTQNGWDAWTRDYTKTQMPEGHLRVTRTASDPGTGWAAHLRSAEVHDFRDQVLRYKWRLNGQGTYCNAWNGTGHSMGFYGIGGIFTTGWSCSGSTVVDDDRWIYTELTVNDDMTWAYTVGYGGYGDGGLASDSGTLSQDAYDALGASWFRASIGDNHATGQYYEIAEASVTPEPVTLVLIGLAGPWLLRRRRR